MYKFYSKNGQAQFYEHGVEIDGTVYGIHADRDILRINAGLSMINSPKLTVISIWTQKLQNSAYGHNVGTADIRTAVTDTVKNI